MRTKLLIGAALIVLIVLWNRRRRANSIFRTLDDISKFTVRHPDIKMPDIGGGIRALAGGDDSKKELAIRVLSKTNYNRIAADFDSLGRREGMKHFQKMGELLHRLQNQIDTYGHAGITG